MKTYEILSNNETYIIKADSVTRLGGVLELSRDHTIVAWFAVWESCREIGERNE